MIAPAIPDSQLAGYRLVRKLAVGSRADVYLGVGSTGTVALKVFRPTASVESIESELDALGRLDSPHLVGLLDLSSGADGRPVLILERVAHGSVASLLAERDRLECGEAVTLLAPIAGLVAQLHDAGVAHGRLGSHSVHIGSARKPILLSLGHCALFPGGGTMAAIDKEPAAGADRDLLATFTLGVLARVSAGVHGGRVRELENWIDSAPRAYEFPRELEARLLACAEPLPIAESMGRGATSAVPARVVPSLPAPLTMEAILENPVELVTRRALAFVRGVRPRFWVIVGATGLALFLTIVLLPSGDPASPHTAVAHPAPTIAIPSSTPLPDDPLRAAQLLLAARRRCIQDLSILCLDSVDEASSSAFGGDAALIQGIEGGGEVPQPLIGTGAASLVERMGDTALLTVATTSPASGSGNVPSILLVKGVDGWRIRDILSGVQATGSSPEPTN